MSTPRLTDEVLEDKALGGWSGSCQCTKTTGRNKRVESVWFPCLDAGSTPASSTTSYLSRKCRDTARCYDILLDNAGKNGVILLE